MTTHSDTLWASSGDIAIAYRVLGDGPIDVVFVPGFVSHVELVWDVHVFAHILRRLGSFSRLVYFDKRGMGLSDRTAELPTLEERADDLRAVMDAVGIDRAAVVAVSEGGQAAMYFAATHPEMVSALVLWVTSSGLRSLPEEERAAATAMAEGLQEFIKQRWGSGESVSLLTGGGMDPADVARFERNSATPRAAADVLRRGFSSDATSVLGSITAPTLVIGRHDDPILGGAHSRALAANIPGARFVDLPGDFHLGSPPEREDDALDAAEEFLTGHKPATMADRVLATVLFTDIVESTSRLTEVGDEKWRQLLDEHDAAIRAELARFRGTEINTTGDGFVARFDGPARAVSCARSIGDRAQKLGLQVRSGVHTGEIELRGQDVAGLAVHIGARVAALAGPSEVLVSSTVRDLTVGSGLEFEDAGMHQLKGVPGEWQLLRVVA